MISLTITSILAILFLGGFLFIYLSPQFGRKPAGEQITSYQLSPNYRDGKFVNQIPTSMGMNWNSIRTLIRDYVRGNPDGRPQKPFPIVVIDSLQLVNNKEKSTKVTWFGHSTFLIETAGLRILIDPMLGNTPAPHPYLGGKRFNAELPITAEVLPPVDVVVFSHDHYDHLDYGSVIHLKDKVSKFYMPLGVGAHLKAWGIPEDKIHELDWGDSVSYQDIKLICTSARHFSGRGLFDRDATLWSSWVIKTPQKNLFFSGDSGYGPHFREIGEKYGPFDFAMIECGQYDERWENIHMMPEQTVKAARDVRAELMMPIHWGAFKLALHDWTDPVRRASLSAQESGVAMITPKIGQSIVLNGSPVVTDDWWKNL